MNAGKVSVGIALLLFFSILPYSVQAKYSGGSGEPNAPYQIASTADLLTLAADVNDYNKCFIMTADIDLDPCLPGGQVFTTAVIAPDDNSTTTYFDGNPFAGVFDGAGYKISNLTIDTNSVNKTYLGLFGKISTGVIKNLRLENAGITAGSSRYTGGLAGNNEGSISNCFVAGSVASGNDSYDVGGLVGSNNGTISYCRSTGVVDGGESSFAVGGLVGYMMLGPSEKAVIINSYSSCEVSDGNDSEYIGGLVGYNLSGSIVNCFSTGNVSAGDEAYGLGGMIGGSGYRITNCFSTGNVTGGINSSCIGGLAGVSSDTDNSYSAGIIVSGSGSTNVGGFAGTALSSQEIPSNCYFLDVAGPNNGYGTPLTDEQMRQQESFIEWDFWGESQNGTFEIWSMPPGGGYPVLSIFNGYNPAYVAGSGTINDPWLVSDSYNLGMLYYRPEGYYKLAVDINFSGIIWSAAPVPVFYGGFDGSNNKIINLTVIGGNYLGFFSQTCGVECTIKNLGLENVHIDGRNTLGGLAGFNGSNINNCFSTGDVNGTRYVGGLVGNNGGSVNECYSNCSVTGGITSTGLGGLVGASKGAINNCFSAGNVNGGNNSTDLGGIAGGPFTGIINNSFSECNVSGGSGSQYLGGIAGRASGIGNCSSTGNITAGDNSGWLGGIAGGASSITNCSSKSTIISGNNSSRLGGLLGVNNGAISRCFSECGVTAGDGASEIGGLVGENNGQMIMNSYSTGAVTGGVASSDVGGLVGRNYYYDLHIDNCYSAGAVSGTSYLGGMIGHNLGGISSTNSYFLDGAGPDNGYGTPLMDAQMKQQANFHLWDFVWETVNGTDDIWAICEGVSYPKLAWQYTIGDSDNDKDVDFIDFARMASKWLQGDSNLYCGGTDLTGDGWVDWRDLAIMCDYWLEGL